MTLKIEGLGMGKAAYFFPVIALLVFVIMELYCRRKGFLPIKYKWREHKGRGFPESIGHFINVYERSQELWFLGGECHHKFWNNPDVINDIRSGRVKVKIASGPYFDLESIELAKLINKGAPFIEYYLLSERENEHHFYVSNTDEVCYHKGNEQNKETTISGSRCIRELFQQEFRSKIQAIHPLQPREFIDQVKLTKPDELRIATEEEIREFKEKVNC